MSSEKEGVRYRTPGRTTNTTSRPHTIFSSQSISNLFNKSKNTQEYSKSFDNASHDGGFQYPRKLSNTSVNTIDCVYSANSPHNMLDTHDEIDDSNSSIYDSAMHKLTSSSKTSSTGGTSAIIKEGYMNKKTDTNASSVSSSLGRSWRLYYVTLRGAKLIFYKPPTEAEIQSTLAHSTGNFQPSPKTTPASSLASIDDGPKNMGMFLIPATFDSAARSFLFEPRLVGPNRSQPPLSENYFYGEMFTEVDVRYFKFKRYTSLLIFNDSIMVFKRRWIHNNRSSIFDTVNSAFKIGSSYNTPPDKVDPTKGYYTKWKHHATYPLLDTDIVDASSTSFNPNSPLPSGSQSNKSNLYSHNNSSASSVATLSSSNDYSSQLSAGTMQAFQLFVRDKQRTTRLFVANNSDSLTSWTNKLQDAKDALTKGSQKNASVNDSPKSASHDGVPLSPQVNQENRAVPEPARVRLFWGLGQHPELVVGTSDNNVVKGGSTDALIHEAIFTSCTGKDYRLAFLYTYKLFTTTGYLCQEIGRYTSQLPVFSDDLSSDEVKMHNRIVQFLLDLIQFCGPNLSADDLSIISNLIEDKLEPLKMPKILELTELWTQTHSIQTKPMIEVEHDSGEMTNYLLGLTKTGLTPAFFLKLDATDLAQQLYLFHYLAYSQHYTKLSDPCQLLGALPEQVRSFSFTPDQPHFLTKLIYHHLFFATPSSSPSRRAALLNHWIQVGLMCRDHGDMASWIAIAIGVCSPVVTRLSETWRSVDKRLTKIVTKRWVPVLVDIGLYTPVHPGKVSVPRCMVLIQEINPKRSASKVVIPFFGPFRQYIARIIDQGGAGVGAFKERAMGFEQYWEVYQTALSLRKQWPESLKGNLFIEAGCPYKSKKFIQDYFSHISTPNHRGHNAFGSELSLEFDFKILHQRSIICEPPFTDDYLNFVHDLSIPTPIFATPFQFPEPISATPTFLDYISTLPLTDRSKITNSHSVFPSSFASSNLNDPSSLFRKRTQSGPVPSASSTQSSRKSTGMDLDLENRPVKAFMDISRAKDMIYVQNRSLVLYSADHDVQDLAQLTENHSLVDLKVQVVAGSPEELVDVLIYGVQDFVQNLVDYEHTPIYLTADSRLDFDFSGFMDMFFSTYRDFLAPQSLFDQLKDNFNRTLSPLLSNQKVEQNLIDAASQDQLKILRVFQYWISYHFYDFFDNPDLRNILFAFLYSISDKMGHILLDSTRKLAYELHLTSESKMLTALSVMSRFSYEKLNVANVQKQLGASPAMETLQVESPVTSPREPITTLDIDHHSCNQIIDAFHHFIIPMMKKASMKDYMLTCTLLEAQSISTWSWLSPGKPTSAAEDETVISDIFMLLDQCRRRASILNSSSTPNMNPGSQNQSASSASPLVNCDRPLVTLFPRHLSDIWQFRDKIRTWTIYQVSSDVDSELRAQRIIKILKMIVICRRQMKKLQSTYTKHLERVLSLEPGVLKSSDKHWLPSFVERALISGLVSSESRSFSYLWAQVASYLGASIDDFSTFITQTQEKFGDELENAEVMVPCVGWIFESAIHLIHYLPDHFSLGSHPMINFQKRQYLGRLIQTSCDWINLFNLKQPNRKGFDIIKLLTYLDSLKKPDWIKVRHTASRENQLIKQGSTSSNYASSIYYYATGHNHGRNPKVFIQLVQEQLDKQKQENREREKLLREVKAHQLNMLKQQQEQAKILDRQMKDQLNRKAKTKELFIMSTLLKPVNGTSQLSSSPNANTSINGIAQTSFSQMPNLDSKKPVHVIKLINCRAVTEHQYTKRDFVFRIITEEGGEYLLQCVDRVNMEEWVNVINDSAKEAAERRVTLLAEDARSQLPNDTEAQSTILSRTLSTNRKSGKGPDRNTVFGVDLKRIMKDNQIPLVVTKCIEEVEARGLMEVGIYRIPGSQSGIERLCRAFDKNSDLVDLSNENWGDINVIACTLKQYLRDLPEPVATYGLYDAFISAVEIEDYEERLFAIKDLLPRLPEENYALLKRIIEHLEKVTDYEEINHMYATNLAIVFGPSLFAPPPSPSSFAIAMGNLGHQQNLVKNMILQYHWLFDIEDEVEGDDQSTAVVPEGVEQDSIVVTDPSFSVDSILPTDISFDNSIDIGLDSSALNITLPDV